MHFTPSRPSGERRWTVPCWDKVRLSFLLFWGIACCIQARAESIRLAWDANSEPDLAGYRLRWGTASRAVEGTLDVGLTTTAEVSGLLAGLTYFFSVTAYNQGGLESAPSDEISHRFDAGLPPTASPASLTVSEDTLVPIELRGSDPDNDPLTFSVVIPPSQGTLLGIPPNVIYRPRTNYAGLDAFAFTVSDGRSTSSPVVVAIVIAPVNDAPVATAGSVTVAEDGVAPVTLAGSDPDGDALTYAVVTGPTRGTLSGTAPNLTYRPNGGYSGADSFTFTVRDGTVTSVAATVAIMVTPVNGAPVATAGSVTVAEDGVTSITLTGSDPDGDALTYTVVTGPTRGTLSGTAPNLTYRPNAGYSGADAFTFTVRDGTVTSAAAVVAIAVTPVNDAPVATAGAVTVAEDGVASITLTGSDPDGDALTYTVVTGPTKGTLSGTAPNLTYRPNTNAYGADSFTFTVRDGTVTSAAATVAITVTPVNDAPVATAGSVTVAEDGVASITLTGSDPDGDALTYAVVTGPTRGTLSGAAPNLTYRPNGGYSGADSFTYTVRDGTVTSAAATVAITVTPVNDAPVATAGSVTVAEDGVTSITLAGSDPDGDALTYAVVTGPTKGTLSGTAPNLTYRPNTNAYGADSFTFTVRDGSITSAAAVVAITVTPVNDAPVATAGSVTVAEDGVTSITLAGSDPDGDALTYAVVTGPTKGTLGGTAPNLTYRPNTNAHGADSFTFTVRDGTVTSAAATVAITVTPVNDAPVATAGSVTVAEDGVTSITLAGSDPDGDALTYAVVTGPTKGTLSGTAPNLTYRPNTNAHGADSFTFNVRDGTVTSAAAVVAITVTPVNDAPVATAGSVTVAEDGAASITLTGSDPDGDALTYAVVTGPTKGLLSGTAPNLTYRPNGGYSGADSVTFTVRDGTVTSAAAVVAITVTPVNGAPVATAGSVTVAEDGVASITLTGSDPDGDALTYAVVTGPTRGTLSGTAPNLTYRPNTNAYGADSFTFTVRDGSITSAAAVVAITVTPVNDAPVATAVSVSVAEDGVASITLTGSDPDGDALTYAVVTGPTRGTLSGAAPNLTYRPNTNAYGADSFTFTVRDGSITSAAAVVAITVTPVNDAPVATAGSVTVAEDGVTSITLAGSDPDGDALTYAVVTGPTKGTLGGTAPNLTYRPNTNAHGADSFTFTVRDGTVTSAAATVAITVTPVNDAPVATAGSVTVAEDGVTSITLAGSDPDGDALTYAVVTGPTKGTLSGTAPNLTYRPNTNAHGADSFTFNVRDGTVTSAAAVVAITVTPVNDAPVATAGSVTVAEDGAASITLTGSDPDGDALTYAVVTGPTKGLLSGTAPNLTYRPNGGYSGADSFTFTVRDGTVTSAAAVVAITVTPVNGAPVATAGSVTVAEDGVASITLTGSDPDGDALTYAVVTGPTRGTLSGTAPNLTYRPNTNAYGADSFTFTVRDGSITSAAAVVAITVTPVNDAPVATAVSVSVAEEGAVSITLAGSDPDGDTLSFATLSTPSKGTLSGIVPNLTYRPNTNFSGTDSFRFLVRDGVVSSASAMVSVTVTPVNDPPAAVAGSASVPEDGVVSIVLSGTDPDGDALQFTLVSGPAHGVVTGTPPNLTYRPAHDYNGWDSLAFTVRDGTVVSSPASIAIEVLPMDETPITQGDVLFVLQGGEAMALVEGTASVLANDLSADGSALGALLQRAPVHGAVDLHPDGTFVYQHDGSPTWEDSFSYVADSASGPSVETEVRIHVLGVQGIRALGGNDVGVAFPVVAGYAYRLEYRDTTPDPQAAWQTLTSFVADADADAEVIVGDGRLLPARFYRAVCEQAGGDLVTEVWGHGWLALSAGSTELVQPFQGRVVRRTAATEVGGSTIRLAGVGWGVGEFGPRDGFASHALMVRDGVSVGQWWPIAGHDGDLVTLTSVNESLLGQVTPGTVVDVVRLPTVADLFGTASDPNRALREGDALVAYSDARTTSWSLVEYGAASGQAPGYYVTFMGNRYGPFDGTTLTLHPTLAFSYRRGTGTADGLLAAGRVQSTAIMHYGATTTTFLGTAFPVPVRIRDAGLVLSGWRIDVDFVLRSTEEDWISADGELGTPVACFYHAGSAGRAAGWYTPVGEPAGGAWLPPGRALRVSLVGRSTWLRWLEPPPW
jgi:hypothetical protein